MVSIYSLRNSLANSLDSKKYLTSNYPSMWNILCNHSKTRAFEA